MPPNNQQIKIKLILKRNTRFTKEGSSGDGLISPYIDSILTELNNKINPFFKTPFRVLILNVLGTIYMVIGAIWITTLSIQIIFIYIPLLGDYLVFAILGAIFGSMCCVYVGIFLMQSDNKKTIQVIPRCKPLLDTYLESNSIQISEILQEKNWIFYWRFDEKTEINRQVRFVGGRNDVKESITYWTEGEIVFIQNPGPDEIPLAAGRSTIQQNPLYNQREAPSNPPQHIIPYSVSQNQNLMPIPPPTAPLASPMNNQCTPTIYNPQVSAYNPITDSKPPAKSPISNINF